MKRYRDTGKLIKIISCNTFEFIANIPYVVYEDEEDVDGVFNYKFEFIQLSNLNDRKITYEYVSSK